MGRNARCGRDAYLSGDGADVDDAAFGLYEVRERGAVANLHQKKQARW
jgi:hypothetical protein